MIIEHVYRFIVLCVGGYYYNANYNLVITLLYSVSNVILLLKMQQNILM